MIFRKSTPADIDSMMRILDEAKDILKERGVDQWQKGYPNRSLLISDMGAGVGYVCQKDEIITGFCAAVDGPEPSYAAIEEGRWLTEGDSYMVIHRMAVGSSFRGQKWPAYLFSEVISMAKALGKKSLRVDTHPENLAMQRTLEKRNFVYCGIIRITYGEEAGDPRLAYELVF